MILAVLEGAYDKPFSDEAANVWVRALSDMPFEATQQAVQRLVRTHTFRPSIAEIRKAVLDYVDPLPSVELAYMEARAAARRFSPYGSAPYSFSHPLIGQALDVVGIETMAYSEEPTIIAAQFRRVYENLRERATVQRQQRAMQLPERGAQAITDGSHRLAQAVADKRTDA